MVLTSGGVPIFHYSSENTRVLDELLSGFLTAITSFASEFGERSVQSLSFEGSELLYDYAENEALFIFLVDSGAPKTILRAVLRDLRKKFLSQFRNELEIDIPIEEVFLDFKFEVLRAYGYYEGILTITSNLSPYVVPQLKKEVLELAERTEGLLDGFHRDFGNAGTQVLEIIDGKLTLDQIGRRLGLEVDEVSDIVEYLSIWGVLRIFKLYPLLEENDSRFDAYLDIIGLPQKDYALLGRVKPLCNGTLSIMDISERVNVTAERLNEVFSKLGDEVNWKIVEVVG